MKKLLTLTGITGLVASSILMVACQTASTNQAELTASKKEFLLANQASGSSPSRPQSNNRLSTDWRIESFGRSLQREIVLRVSDCDEGQDLCRETKPIQRI